MTSANPYAAAIASAITVIVCLLAGCGSSAVHHPPAASHPTSAASATRVTATNATICEQFIKLDNSITPVLEAAQDNPQAAPAGTFLTAGKEILGWQGEVKPIPVKGGEFFPIALDLADAGDDLQSLGTGFLSKPDVALFIQDTIANIGDMRQGCVTWILPHTH